MNNIPLNAYTMTCLFASLFSIYGFPGGAALKNPPDDAGAAGENLCVEKIPWKRKQQPTPLCLPGKPQGQRNLMGYSP